MEEILNLVILVLEHHPDGSSKYSFRKIGEDKDDFCPGQTQV